MKTYRNLFVVAAMVVFVVPQVALAAWWNPFTWNIFPFNKKESKTQVQQIQNTTATQNGNTGTSTTAKKDVTKPLANTVPRTKMTNQISAISLSNSQIIKKIKPTVVYISTKTSAGSGMIFSADGYVLTNAHVVKGVNDVSISISTGETLYGAVVGRDENADLAVIKLNTTKPLLAVDFGDSSKVEQGDEVFTFGFPFGIEGDVSFKEGTISRRIEGYFETSAEIHPGNSGGPLINRYGQVIGINTAIFGKSISGVQLGETIKLAIPSNTAKNLISELKAGRNIVVNTEEKKPVEKQQEKRVVNENACLAESQRYYDGLVSPAIEKANASSQKTNSEYDQCVATAKTANNAAGLIKSISNFYDSMTSSARQSYENTVRSVAALDPYGVQHNNQATIDTAREEMESKIAGYENSKQSEIKAIADRNISSCEMKKNSSDSSRESILLSAQTSAKVQQAVFYQQCLNQR